MKKLTVVIVSYNVRHYLTQCLVSVQRAARDIDHEIIVVDNDSTDDTVDYLRKHFAQSITLIESQHNLGFARANNIAIRQSQSQYVLLLNPDTIISEDSLSLVLDFMDSHPKAGGAGACMMGADGSLAPESRRALPTPWVSMLKMLGFSRKYYMSHLPWDKPSQIDIMSGAFCMLRREALNKVGLLDETFFMYGEDIDLSYRILKGGFENWYVPAKILHYKGESTKKSTYRYVHIFYQAMLIFFRKHYSHASLLVTLPIKAAIYFRALLALVQMQYQRIRTSLGFDHTGDPDMQYFLQGSEQMKQQCTLLAQRKGLQIHDGELPEALPRYSCIVFDTEGMSFSDIFARLQQLSANDPILGTYYPGTQTIITPFEAIE
ncbi:MAG: glycosyltransferase family 2 protein [Prevotella sp.]|nr:glycosyltransferase family 2 protein [Prevotella sp.]